MTAHPSDHALAVIKAAVNLVPVIGGSLASLIGDYVPQSTERNVGRALGSLNADLTRLASRIDAELIDKEEFAELFKTSYLILVRSHHQERTRAAIQVIINSLLLPNDPGKLTFTELDHFVRCLDQLSLGALRVLGRAVLLARRISKTQPLTTPVAVAFHELQAEVPEYSPDLLMGLVGELDRANLLHRPGAPTIRAIEYKNYKIEVTTLGARFVDSLLSEA